jgi:hypothetical protein
VTIKEVYELYILHVYVVLQPQTFYGWLYNSLQLYIVPQNSSQRASFKNKRGKEGFEARFK